MFKKILKNIKVKIEKEELEVNEIISDDNKSNITTEETTKEEE